MDPEPTMSIGEIAEATGVPATALRYYEQIGLVPPPPRVGGRRRFGAGSIRRVHSIQLCRAAGFSLAETAVLLDDRSPGRAASRQLAVEKLKELDRHLEQLHGARELIELGMRCTCPSVEECTCSNSGPF